MWLGGSATFGDHGGCHLLPGDSLIPQSLTMWGGRTLTAPRTTSAPSEHDALPCLDFEVLPPLLLPLVKQLLGNSGVE